MGGLSAHEHLSYRMSWLNFSAYLFSYLAQIRPALTKQRSKKRDMIVVQTSPSADIFNFICCLSMKS